MFFSWIQTPISYIERFKWQVLSHEIFCLIEDYLIDLECRDLSNKTQEALARHDIYIK